jgi:hypothetical protein
MQMKIATKLKPYGGFVVAAVIFLLVWYIFTLQSNVTGAQISLSLGLTVLSVTIVEMIWRTLGGGPMDKMLEQLSSAVPLLGTFKDAGLDGFFVNRKDVEFKDFLCNFEFAKKVDMMALSLRDNWTSNGDFVNIIKKRAASGECVYRFLVLNPTSEVTVHRSFEEKDIVGHLSTNIRDSLIKLSEVSEGLSNSKKQYLSIKTNSDLTMYCSIIRADDRMFVSFYLASVRGSGCPTLKIQGNETALFKKFSAEFEKLWSSAKPYPA